MLKKLKDGGGRIGYVWIGLVSMCLLLAVTGCKKKVAAHVVGGQPQVVFADSPATVAAMESRFSSEDKALREKQMARLKAFAAEKEKQAEFLASGAGETVSGEARDFFKAAKKGDYATVRSMFKGFSKRAHQYANNSKDTSLDTSYWGTLLEVDLAYLVVVPMDPTSVRYFADDIINSIPEGSIYFGGTDPGRGLITAFCNSHWKADPFFTLTQNALADGTYMEYLLKMYGTRINIPSVNDSQKAINDYEADAKLRFQHDQDHPGEPHQIKPGEDVHLIADGKLEFGGQVAVMTINGLLVKNIFDHNPDKEFYIEESFPLDWMYPYLEPHGPIMKLDRNQLTELPATVIAQDREYWRARVGGMIGDWLTDDTSVAIVADFVDKVYVRKDLAGFTGDKLFIENSDSQKTFSKLRSSIGGVYEWRARHATSAVEKQKMTAEADFAYRQAFALCPDSPETVFRYINLLTTAHRIDDAILVATASTKVDPKNKTFAGLLQQLKGLKK